MLNCLADKGLKAIPIRGVSETPPGRSSIDLGQYSRLEHSVQSRRRHAMATKGAQSIQNTCTASNNIIDVGSHCKVVCKSDAQTEMCWTLSKTSTMGDGRSVCRQDLGLVDTISLDLDRLTLVLLVSAHCSICWISALQVF